MIRDKIDGVLIDPDENGFHLILSGEQAEYNFTLDGKAALELMNAVKTEIVPWWGEALEALNSPHRSLEIEDERVVDVRDPKHPEHHAVFSELAAPDSEGPTGIAGFRSGRYS